VPVGVNYGSYRPLAYSTDGFLSDFAIVEAPIQACPYVTIEYPNRLLEADTVFEYVASVFGLIPFEQHRM
jgi:hypothetical protein